jgi:hypothetical protein
VNVEERSAFFRVFLVVIVIADRAKESFNVVPDLCSGIEIHASQEYLGEFRDHCFPLEGALVGEDVDWNGMRGIKENDVIYPMLGNSIKYLVDQVAFGIQHADTAADHAVQGGVVNSGRDVVNNLVREEGAFAELGLTGYVDVPETVKRGYRDIH